MANPIGIPLSQPVLGVEERQALDAVLRSGRLSFGPRVEAFEQAFTQTVGCPYAVAVSSGTAALHLCMVAAGIGPGDEVLTSPFSFVASANCIEYVGAKPVFVDIEPESLGMNPGLLEAHTTANTRAIVPVHVFGQCCHISKIQSFAQNRGISLWEDACESLTATHKGKQAGTWGSAGTFGFYPNKQITTGEGGMIVTADPVLADTFRSLRNQGRAPDMQWLRHERLGYNYRIHELTAALGEVQLQRLPVLQEKRQQVAAWYEEYLAQVPNTQLPTVASGNTHSWFVYAIRVPAKLRNRLIRHLAERGIQSKAYFFPCIHLQPYYQEKYGYREGDFPVAEQVSRETLILPFFPEMTEAQVERVAQALREGVELS